ncbi:hypothetical protein ACWEF9_38935, partial [Streptomyces sp. NPDC004980]
MTVGRERVAHRAGIRIEQPDAALRGNRDLAIVRAESDGIHCVADSERPALASGADPQPGRGAGVECRADALAEDGRG